MKRHRIARISIRLAIWFALLCFVGSWFGKLFFVAELLSNLRFHFCVVFLFSAFLIYRIKLGRSLLVVVLVAFVASIFHDATVYIAADQPPGGDTRLRLMTYNVLATNTDFASAIEEIQRHDPDVVAVAEYANRWHDAMKVLADDYPHCHCEPRWHGYGIAIFSKLPLESKSVVQLTEKTIDNPALAVEVQVDQQRLRIVACHVMSPTNAFRLGLRNQQFREIANMIKRQAVPTVLMGDFNCAPGSTYLQELASECSLRDSRKGFGRQATWPGLLPSVLSIPIDHALVSNSVHVHHRQVGDARGSDHRPVIIDVSLAPVD